MMDFPKTLAAAKRAKGAEWSLADALYEEVGPRGAESKFLACREYLADYGIDYSAMYLKRLHAASRAAQGCQPPWATPEHLIAAGSLEVIEAAVAAKKERAKEESTEYEPPSKRELQVMRKAVTRHQRASKGTQQMPERDKSRAKPRPTSELRHQANVLGLGNHAGHAARDGRSFVEQLAGRELDDDDIDYLLAEIDTVLTTWKVARDAVRNPLAASVERFLQEQA